MKTRIEWRRIAWLARCECGRRYVHRSLAETETWAITHTHEGEPDERP